MTAPAKGTERGPEATVEPCFWQGRRVLLTGHTGFKGGWLLWWLHQMGAEVTGYALPPERDHDLFHTAGLDAYCASVLADVRDQERLTETVTRANPEIVFHLAAQPLVRRSYARPVETFAVNVMGTAHLLEACRGIDGLKGVVVITTDKVYENAGDGQSFRESDPLGGAEPYGYSKAGAEMAVAAWRRAFFTRQGIPVASARSGNVIGGGDWSEDRLVPDAMRAFAAGQEMIVRAPEAVRPWQHVVEPLAGYLLLAQALSESDAGDLETNFARGWNFGPAPDQCYPVRDVVTALAEAWNASGGSDASWRADPPADAPHEAASLLLRSEQARQELGWRSRLTMTEAVSYAVDWYRAAHDGASANDLRARMSAQMSSIAPMLRPLDAASTTPTVTGQA